MAYDAEWSNVTTRHCKGRGCGGRKPPPVEALRALMQDLNRLLDLPLMGFVDHCAEDFSTLTAISQPIPFLSAVTRFLERREAITRAGWAK